MSIENHYPNAFKSHSGYEQKEKIPDSWFSAVGTKNDGIASVSFSQEFVKKFGLGIVKLMTDYGDMINHRNGPNVKQTIKSMSQEEREKLKEIEYLIKEKTGFSFKELVDRKKILEDVFTGKTDAPFPVELF